MPSILKEVFEALDSQKMDTNLINNKIQEIQREIDRLKQDTRKFIVDNYIEFLPTLKKDQDLLVKVEQILKEISHYQNTVDNQIKIKLQGSTKELQELSNSLKEVKQSLLISSQLLELHRHRLSAKKFIQSNQYVAAAETLNKINKMLSDESLDIQDLEIMKPLKTEYNEMHSNLCKIITSLWQKNVVQEEIVNLDGKKTNKMYLVQPDALDNFIKAMPHIEDRDRCVQEFCRNLFKLFVKPIIISDCSVYTEKMNSLNSRFSMVFVTEIREKTATFNYKCILYNLTLLFKYLVDLFNLKLKLNEHFLMNLCESLYPELSRLLINDVVAKTIPTSSSELEKFTPIREEILEFEKEMIELGFISEDGKFLTEYVMNVDHLYTQKIRQGYLVRAKEIMKKDLHDSVKFTPKEPLQLSPEMMEDVLNITFQKLNSSTFQLPACQISKSTKEILELIEEILDETCRNSDDCAVRLSYTTRDIIEMYIGLVPLHHKQFLNTIPQQVALFHNNCMYLAHHLLTLVYKYEDKLPAAIQKHNLTYTDQVLSLRLLGAKYFLNQMTYQRDIIYDIITESGLSKIGQSPKLREDTEKALRQCIRQLELLKTVWLNVLPEKVYCRAIGCIMNAMVEELICRVTSVEDIHVDVATELITLYNVVVRRAPAIFPETEDIQQHVRKWNKLKELIIILGASLKEIEERWASGNGPLAQEFSADNVKQLIKALFQNTDRRSAVLSKIKS